MHVIDGLSGSAVGHSIASGKARVLKDVSQMNQFQKGEILVTEMVLYLIFFNLISNMYGSHTMKPLLLRKTDPDWEPIFKKAKGVITDRGGRSSHAAITSRELGTTKKSFFCLCVRQEHP